MAAARFSNAAVNTALNAETALLNNGYLRIYSGSQPATADTALSGQTLLAELRFANPTAFAAAVAGVATANAITADASANNTGTATWFRCLQSDGTTVVCDGDVSVTGGGGNLELATTSITAGTQVQVTAFTVTLPKQV